MPTHARPPMPKLPPFALAQMEPRPKRPQYLLVFFLLFAAPLVAIHLPLFGLPFFWDEHGQFVPTALDLLRSGSWIAHSTIPNVHPPGMEVYLVLWYKLFGFSIPITRVAMLLLASLGLLVTFLLAIELSRGAERAPAFLPVLLLAASPLFYTQSMMAQLDMPAMVFTIWALLLFIRKKYATAAIVSIVLVMMKETGIVTPFVFFVVLMLRKDWMRAGYFIAPALALAGWLLVLHRGTGYWLGNPGFAHYNVGYSLHPVRIAFSFVRRFYYLFFADFRWIGTLVLVGTGWKRKVFRTDAWRVTIAVSLGTIVLVSIFGGAELERYLLPVLPVFYIAVSVASTCLPRPLAITAIAGLVAGLIVSIFWNPPYPFPYENNYAMVDFVRLEQLASGFAERNFPQRRIATAWPYTAGLESPAYGFVKQKLRAIETNDFHPASIRALPPASFDVLIMYTRTWAPGKGVISIPLVRRFLTHFYQWAPDITPEECAELGLKEVVSWQVRGQAVTIYVRSNSGSGT